jgi:hypothetical protein
MDDNLSLGAIAVKRMERFNPAGRRSCISDRGVAPSTPRAFSIARGGSGQGGEVDPEPGEDLAGGLVARYQRDEDGWARQARAG